MEEGCIVYNNRASACMLLSTYHYRCTDVGFLKFNVLTDKIWPKLHKTNGQPDIGIAGYTPTRIHTAQITNNESSPNSVTLKLPE